MVALAKSISLDLVADAVQVFARKVIRLFGSVEEEDVLNELRAVIKLCVPGAHKNIVPVFRHGSLSPSMYFLDMECCVMNLECWIQRRGGSTLAQKVPYLTANLPSRMRSAQIWEVMEDLTNAVTFIHSLGEVHRDLKPRNSTFPV